MYCKCVVLYCKCIGNPTANNFVLLLFHNFTLTDHSRKSNTKSNFSKSFQMERKNLFVFKSCSLLDALQQRYEEHISGASQQWYERMESRLFDRKKEQLNHFFCFIGQLSLLRKMQNVDFSPPFSLLFWSPLHLW